MPRDTGDRIVLSDAARELHSEARLAEPWQGDPIDLTIFVSCYNEQDFVTDTLDAIAEAMSRFDYQYEVLIIDDVSKDNSAAVVERYIAEHPDRRIILKKNGVNRGLAQNYVDGAFLGRGKYYRLICGDNAEPVDTIATVMEKLGQADIILPYYTSFEGKSLFRRTLSKAYSGIINVITGRSIKYYNGLALPLRYNVMRWHPTTRGFGFQAEIMTMLLDDGATCIEVPAVTVELKGGASRALDWRNVVSVSHSVLTIAERRLSNWIYR